MGSQRFFSLFGLILCVTAFVESLIGAPLKFTIESKWTETDCRVILSQLSGNQNHTEYQGISGSRKIQHSGTTRTESQGLLNLAEIMAESLKIPKTEPVHEGLDMPGQNGNGGRYKITLRPSSPGEVFIQFDIETDATHLAKLLDVEVPNKSLTQTMRVAEAKFIKGDWNKYLAGEDIELELTGKGIPLIQGSTEVAEKVFSERMKKLGMNMSDYGFQVLGIRFKPRITTGTSRLSGNKQQLTFELGPSEFGAEIDFTIDGLDISETSDSSILALSNALLELEKSASANSQNKAFKLVAETRRSSLMMQSFLWGPGLGAQYYAGTLTRERILEVLAEIPQAQKNLREIIALLPKDGKALERCNRLIEYTFEVKAVLEETLNEDGYR